MLYRVADDGPEVLLVHPGGPFWAKKDLGAWSIPKGEYEPDEDPRAAALREFEEGTGTRLPTDELVELGLVVQKGGKEVTAWAVRGDLDATAVRSNSFEIRVYAGTDGDGRRQHFYATCRGPAARPSAKPSRRRASCSPRPRQGVSLPL